MSQAQTQQIDPAVEEVLASIRQIMANDLNDTDEKPGNDIISFPLPKKATSRKRSDENRDILTLTEMITNDGSVISLNKKEAEMAAKPVEEEVKEEPAAEEEKSAASESLDLKEEEVSLQAEDTEVKIVSAEEMESLMSPEAVAQSTEAFNDLNKLTEEMKQKIQSGTFGAQTLDELMREMLRPLLKEWLDSHLPSLVKWLVAEKIEQMIREKQSSSKKGA